MERAPSENYKPDKTGEFRSRAFVESISPTTILPFLQQEIETFITPRIRDRLDSNSLVGKILRDLRLDENYKWNRRWIIKSPETREDDIFISVGGWERKVWPMERTFPFRGESFQIVEWELGTRYAHWTGALDVSKSAEIGVTNEK